MDKRRVSGSEVKQVNLIGGPLEGKVCVIFDDMISTAGSVVGAAEVALRHGARAVYACIRTACFAVRHSTVSRIGPQASRGQRFGPAAGGEAAGQHSHPERRPLLADAIKRIHANESVSVLFE